MHWLIGANEVVVQNTKTLYLVEVAASGEKLWGKTATILSLQRFSIFLLILCFDSLWKVMWLVTTETALFCPNNKTLSFYEWGPQEISPIT